MAKKTKKAEPYKPGVSTLEGMEEPTHSIPLAARTGMEAGIPETQEEAQAKETAASVEASGVAQVGSVEAPHEAQPHAQEGAAASLARESPSSIDSILDKPPLTQRIKEALALVDRVDKQKLCEQLGSPIAEFKAAVTELVEVKVVKDDALNKTLYLLLTEEERKEYQEDKATVRRDDRFKSLTRIHDHRTYREDYPSWDEFLHHELCLENPHDWWETEKRTARIQQQMNAEGLKLKVPFNKKMAQHLNRVRNDAALFASCVTEFQRLPQDRQIAKRLGEIVERHLDRQNKLASLRQFVPDATEEELAILAHIYAADHKWRCWYPQHTEALQERVQTSGRPVRDCMLEIAQENKALPSNTVLLGVARGADLVPLVNDLMRLQREWQRQHDEEEKRKKWIAEGIALKIFDPNTGKVKDKSDGDTGQSKVLGPDGKPMSSAVIVAGAGDTPPARPDPIRTGGDEDDDGDTTFDVDLTGQFAEEAEHTTLTAEGLADLLRNMADALDDGWVITRPSSLTVRPAVRKEQSA